MTSKERLLYHQLHPAKLAVDLSTAVVTVVLFWRHELVLGLVIGFVPSIVVSAILVRGDVDLDRYATSRAGRYLAWHMTRGMEAVRFAGFFLALAGAWWHRPWLIPVGASVVVSGWLAGLLPRRRSRLSTAVANRSQ